MTTIPFNLNWYIRVKLKPDGIDILRKDFESYCMYQPFVPPAVDAEGWSQFQAWEFMRIFGPHINIGMHTPFETTIELEIE